MRSVPADLPASIRALLPGADFADAFSRVIDDPSIDASIAARRIAQHQPGWIASLMRLRDAIVRPLGLRTADDPSFAGLPRVGPFPVVSSTPERVVLGFDDRHLDFRLVIDVLPHGELRREIVVKTLVRTHNRLGRVYLATILPFHRRIVPALLGQVIVGAPATRN